MDSFILPFILKLFVKKMRFEFFIEKIIKWYHRFFTDVNVIMEYCVKLELAGYFAALVFFFSSSSSTTLAD
jgi:hypothetical protein